MANTGLGRWHNVPRPGQRGFRPTRDHYDLTGQVLPRYQQCELSDCQDLAITDPVFRASYSLKLCEYHTRLCTRIGAPYPCDIPWAEFYSIRDAVLKQLNKVKDTPVLVQAVDAVERFHQRCQAGLTELQDADRHVPAHLSYGASLSQRADPLRLIGHHVAFGVMLERGIWQPRPGYTRHTDKAWLRCIHRALSRGKKAERAGLGPYRAGLLRKMIAPDLRILTGRTDYALREAELIGRDVLPRRDALGWFQDTLA